MKGGKAYLIGDGFTKDGQHPFIDEMDVKSLKKKRLYTSNLKNAKEEIIDIIDPYITSSSLHSIYYLYINKLKFSSFPINTNLGTLCHDNRIG